MSGSFRTELPTMQAASQHVFGVNEQIQGQLSSLLGRLEPLAGAWQGEASSSFTVLREQWHTSALKLNDALRSIGEALVASQGNYANSEETNRAGFSGISSVLG